MVRECHVFWGPTHTGKSHTAWELAGPGGFAKNPRTKYWCGYRGQETAVIDEFRGAIDVAYLLGWTDKYPISVEVKGSSVPYAVKRLYITSNLNPESWYPELDQDSREALLRKMIIHHMEERYVCPE